jgi:hypothetical protein
MKKLYNKYFPLYKIKKTLLKNGKTYYNAYVRDRVLFITVYEHIGDQHLDTKQEAVNVIAKHRDESVVSEETFNL